MHKVYLLLGSNLGDRRSHLRNALRLLADHGAISRTSSVYRSAAWGNTSQPDFLNVTAEFMSALPPGELLDVILSIETSIGRERTEKWGPRLIDIDILFFDTLVIKTPALEIPHPQIQNRRFTLEPLAEISPELEHPVLQKTITQLLKSCDDSLAVEKEGDLDKD